MNLVRKVPTFALAASMIAAPIVATVSTSAYADAIHADAVSKLGAEAKSNAIIRTADEAFAALREIRAARLAILNGETDLASKFATAAKNNLTMSEIYMKSYVLDSKTSHPDDEFFIPFDTELALSEGFVATPEKAKELAKVNEHLSKGDQKEAIEALSLARVDVTISTALMPAKAGLAHVKDALTLMEEKKFYEANLALKAVEDAVIIEFYSIDEIPAQGNAG